MTICGGVLVPQAHPTTGRFRRCFVEEARRDSFTPAQLASTHDWYVPKTYGGEGGAEHRVHRFCSDVQGGMIGDSAPGGRVTNALLTPEQRSAGGRASAAALTPEQRSAAGRVGGPVGACVQWNVRRGKPCTCGRHT